MRCGSACSGRPGWYRAQTDRAGGAACRQLAFGWCRQAYRSERDPLQNADTDTGLSRKGAFAQQPAADVEPVGRRKKGKRQLRAGEAVKFLDRALDLASQDNPASDGALASAMALLMGLRAQEISRQVVRDVDLHARVLHVEDAKTEAGNRRVEIPEVLWPHVEKRLDGTDPFEPLFPARSKDGFHHKEWVGESWKRENDTAPGTAEGQQREGSPRSANRWQEGRGQCRWGKTERRPSSRHRFGFADAVGPRNQWS